MPIPETSPPVEIDRSNVLVTTGVLDLAAKITEIRLGDGRVLRLPTSVLEGADQRSTAAEAEPPSMAETIVPIAEQRLRVNKRVVATGTVRLRKTVQAYETALDEPLAARTYDVERVAINQPVETAPPIRQEGETTIYPVVEEQAIVTKQLVLKEEIRVTKRDTERRDQQTVTLRREHIESSGSNCKAL